MGEEDPAGGGISVDLYRGALCNLQEVPLFCQLQKGLAFGGLVVEEPKDIPGGEKGQGRETFSQGKLVPFEGRRPRGDQEHLEDGPLLQALPCPVGNDVSGKEPDIPCDRLGVFCGQDRQMGIPVAPGPVRLGCQHAKDSSGVWADDLSLLQKVVYDQSVPVKAKKKRIPCSRDCVFFEREIISHGVPFPAGSPEQNRSKLYETCILSLLSV